MVSFVSCYYPILAFFSERYAVKRAWGRPYSHTTATAVFNEFSLVDYTLKSEIQTDSPVASVFTPGLFF